VDEKLIRDLASLRFLDNAADILFVGPPGVGIARAVIDAGHRVYLTTAADLAARCHKAALERTLEHPHAILRRAQAPRH
jgi:DNA replication protein DnaC